MEANSKPWRCGHCPYAIPLPPPSAYLYAYVLGEIRDHRLSHLILSLAAATDEDIMAMSGDTPKQASPVQEGDTPYVLAGITKLLKNDLSRARKEHRDYER